MLKYRETGGLKVNKAHALAYALVSVITAYLKLYHPGVFFAESLNAVADLREILDFTKELPAFHLTLHAPDLRMGNQNFLCVGTDIYYGLSYINGLSNVPYTYADNFFDFVAVNKDTVKAATLEKLIRCGLFDSTCHLPRRTLIAFSKDLYKGLAANEKTQDAIDKLEDQLAYIRSFAGKTRLKKQEKAELVRALGLRRRVDTITIKDIAKYEHSFAEKLSKKHREMSDTLTALRTRFESLQLTEQLTRADVANNRADERALLGYVFDTASSMDALSGCNAFPDGTIDMRTPVTHDIPNLGLVVLDPCVRTTPGGWTKILCCDKNHTYKHFYFEGEFPTDITEFVLNFQAEHLQDCRGKSKSGDAHSNNMYIAPHAYHLSDIGYEPLCMYYVEHVKDFRKLTGKLYTKETFPTATLTCLDMDIHVPCKKTQVEVLLKENHINYVMYPAKRV